MSDELERLDASGPTVSDRVLKALGTAPFLSILFLATLLWTGLDYYRQLDQETWVAVPATLTKIDASHSSRTSYLEVTYAYAHGEQRYTGEYTYTVREVDFDEERIPTLKAGYEAILNHPDAATCYVDPSQPDRSVLERATMTRWTVGKLLVALVLLAFWWSMVRERWTYLPMAQDTSGVHTLNASPDRIAPRTLKATHLSIFNSPFESSVTLPMIFGAFVADPTDPGMPIWQKVLFYSVILAALVAASKLPCWWTRWRNCASRLELDATPVPAGEYVQGSIILQGSIPQGTPFRLQLMPDWDNYHPSAELHGLTRRVSFMGFRKVDTIATASFADAGISTVPIRLPIPQLRSVDGKAIAPSRWYLIAHATLTKGKYQAAFEIPVRDEASNDATDDFLATPNRSEAISNFRIEALRHARIFVERTEDALEIRLPAPRIPFRAFVTLCFGIFFLLPVLFRIVLGFSAVIPLIAIFWSLGPWLSSTQLHVTQDAITIRRGFLRRRPRTFPFDPQRGWTSKDDHIGTHLYFDSAGRGTTLLVKWLPNEYIATLLHECIDEYVTEKKEANAVSSEERRIG